MTSAAGNYWVHDLDPVIFWITDSLAVRWYGLAYALGFVIAAWLLRIYYAKGKTELSGAARETLMMAIIFGVLLGGRFGYMLFYRLEDWLADPLLIVRVWEGGMASHGGFIGVTLAVAWTAWKHRLSFLHLGDLIATVVAPGLLLGRIANFINGELWGKPTSVGWAVIFPDAPLDPAGPVVALSESGTLANPRHPSQLYQAFGEGMFLLVYMQLRFWCSKTARRYPGQLAGECFMAYAIVRIVSERFREPDAALILGMSRGTFYSWFLLLVGLGLIIYARRRASADCVTEDAPAAKE